ncbi:MULTISPECIES: hypothetical protein [unclassified Bradyrhizobium]|nr:MULTISPECIES: hypothetical protein [unclassified Bradyrhizobium]
MAQNLSVIEPTVGMVGDLRAIARKAMPEIPQSRFATVQELAGAK